MKVIEGWNLLGIRLREDVLNFTLPYCKFVVTTGPKRITDMELDDISNEIFLLSQEVKDISSCPQYPWVEVDLCFSLARIIYGIKRSLREKVEITREILYKGKSYRLDPLIDECNSFIKDLL
jgi:hypothetical protein